VAAHLYSPYVAPDETKLADAVELFRETGHPLSVTTLERRCRKAGVPLVRHGRANHASWSAMLKVHAAWVDAREAGH
jgi:hypothetical protein